MRTKIFHKPLLIIAIIGGIWLSMGLQNWFTLDLSVRIALGGLGGILIYGGGYLVLRVASRLRRKFNRWLDSTSIEILLCGTAGLLLGVMVGLLISYPLSMLRGIGSYFAILSFLLFGYLGMEIGSRRAMEVWTLLPGHQSADGQGNENTSQDYKVLDTSAIIDGRIYDVCLSKFLEGTLIVPVFVIEELQHIADSSDNLRRGKGRRGLDLLSKMQKNPNIKIKIVEDTGFEEKEVDMKLVRLCKQLPASIITNDYNLNKVAELQGIKVLNINELINAVKVVVYPGETMYINILKEGKEPGQGVGYLEDGTMVVVEDAQDQLGCNLEVVVTSVFQTAAGRMIFSRKVKEDRNLGIFKTNLNGEPIQEVNMFG